MKRAVIVGAGPAGLMAADILSRAGVQVTIADQMPSVGRKFLMAGKSGLNLTKTTPRFLEAYGEIPDVLRQALQQFGPEQVIAWCEDLGQKVFQGSTGRIFPEVMKASPLLRAWLSRLEQQGVTIKTRWVWTGHEKLSAEFLTPDGRIDLPCDALLLALGGGSWKRLGSDGAWANRLADTSPFEPSNVGLQVQWSEHMARHFGKPLKDIQITAGDHVSRGEIVLSERGIEGGGIYEVSRAIRDGADIKIDLKPNVSLAELKEWLARPRGKDSLSNHLRKRARLDPVSISLLNEWGRPFPREMSGLIKSLPVRHAGPRPLDEAISTAGGLRFEALDGNLMLRQRPGVFACGEMLDWDAPTGGYLLTACFATGRHAAIGALQHLGLSCEML